VATVEWESVPLGEVAKLDIERVAVDEEAEYRLVGVLIAGQGLFWRDTIRGRETNYATLHRLREGQLVMRKLTAWEGPITTVPAEFDGGYVSSEFPTFTLDESRLLPDYMRLVCRRPAFHAEMRIRSTGTAERRNRLKPDDLLSIAIELPQIEEQAHSVEAMRAIDTARDAISTEAAACEDVLAAARVALIDDGEFDVVQLGDVLEAIDAGKSPKVPDRPPTLDEWGVVKVSSIRPGRFIPSEAKALPPDVRPWVTAKINAGDVLTVRGSGSRRLIGSVCRVKEDPGELLLSDLVLRMRFDCERVDPDYVVHALSTPAARAQIEEETKGTTTLGKISRGILRGLEIPLPARGLQSEIASRLEVLSREQTELATEKERLDQLRVSLLDSLLSGQHRIGRRTEELAPA
jgi:type I restriction enzyme S subunit